MLQQQNIHFTFKRATQDDLPILFAWFKEQHVKQWWPVPEPYEKFFEHFIKRIRSPDTVPFLIFINDMPLGYIQYYRIAHIMEKPDTWLPELPQDTVGIDQFIGDPQYIGKGYGTLLIKAFITYLITDLEPSINTIIVDPEPENEAAVRCYEKVGFKRIGTYETSYGLALLMLYDVKEFF